MSRTIRRAAVASLVVGLGLAGPAAWAADGFSPFGDLLNIGDVGRVMDDDLPHITGDVQDGLGGLLGGDTGGLLGGILGGTDGLLGGLLGGLGLSGDTDLEIQPVPSLDGSLADPKVGGGLLDGLLGIGSLTQSLAGHL
jgi:hypothetical protein